jgi:hypothetical protein
MDLSDTDEPISFMVETANSLTPVIQDSDVNINNGVYEINLATFDVDTASISNLVNVAPVIGSIKDIVGDLDDLTTINKSNLVDATNEINGKVENAHKVTRLSVSTSGWTSDTSSQSGTTLYKKSVALNHVYVESPSVDIGASGVLPTSAQQEAYNLLQYVTCDSAIPCLYLYASDIPTTAFYINVEGVD